MNKMYYNQYQEGADGSKSWSQFGISGGQPMMNQAYPQPPVIYNDPRLIDECQRLTNENARLHREAADKLQAETAYQDVHSFPSGGIVTIGRRGQIVEITNLTFNKAYSVIPEPLCLTSPFLVIDVRAPQVQVRISRQDFENDRRLKDTLVEATHSKIRRVGSVRKTMDLLRQAIAEVTESVPICFYAGWKLIEVGKVKFYQFADLKTHQINGSLYPPDELSCLAESLEAESQVVDKMVQLFGIIRDRRLRTLLVLLWHAATLFSLLKILEFPLPVGINLLCETAGVEKAMTGLFSLFGDPTIILSERKEDFCYQLLSRKDQVAIIRDDRGAPSAAENARELLGILSTQSVSVRLREGRQTVPLQALPLIISDRVSDFAYSPLLLTVDLSMDDIDGEKAIMKCVDMNILKVYYAVWIKFIAERLGSFKYSLAAGKTWALEMEDRTIFQGQGELTAEGVDTLAVLYAVWDQLQQFYRRQQICVDVDELLDVECFPSIFSEILELSVKKDDCGQLASSFIKLFREMLAQGEFTAAHLNCYQDGCVGFDEEFAYLPHSVFKVVCGRLSASSPMVIKALGEEGLLAGRPVNRTTQMTRVTVQRTDVDGIKKGTLRGFKIAREVFEFFGEPSIFEEEC